MVPIRFILLATLMCVSGATAIAAPRLQTVPGISREASAQVSTGQWRTVTVDGVERQFLLFPNSAAAPSAGAPLVLVFHGHGGSARGYAAWVRIQELWPDAIVAYLQGLPGAAGITDQAGQQAGWQMRPGDLGDRDVRFVDAMLADLQRDYPVNPDAVYAYGHSNGAAFVSVLWSMRGEVFAAFGTVAGLNGRLIVDATPRSLFMVMGQNDPLVPYTSQVLGAAVARRTLQTDPSKATTDGYLRLEPGTLGTELAVYAHPGGHTIPLETVPLVVSFFQRHQRPPRG